MRCKHCSVGHSDIGRGAKRSVSSVLEEFEIPFPAHARCTEQVLDDKDGNVAVGGNHERAYHSRFGVNEVIALLMVEDETVLLEDRSELSVGDGTKWGHYATRAFSRPMATNSGASHEPSLRW